MDDKRMLMLWPLAGFMVAIAFGVGLIAMAAFDSDDVAGAAPASASGGELNLVVGELYMKPATLTAEAGPLVVRVHNEGQIEHNFAVPGLGSTEMIPPGETVTLDLGTVEPGSYPFLCEVTGHADGGMKGVLEVSGETQGSTDQGSSHQGAGMAHMSAKQMAIHDAERTGSFPAATKGKGGRVLAPEIASDGTKVFELTAEVVDWETEPGKTVEAWAYNGMVPGPTLKASLGDKVRIVLHNELPEPTTLHLHGMTVPNDMDGVPAINQDAILPGESFTYEFTVRNTGSNMYHSHFDSVKQVPMGLLGAFIIEDPKDPPADVDYTMILNDGPLGFTLNGKGFPGTEPIVASHGDVVRIRYMNEGLQIHPMHLHGMAQKVIAKDGHLLRHPHWEDTILVAPGERFDVLVKATEVGTWAFHCHILSHAEGPDGMFGMVTAMVVQ